MAPFSRAQVPACAESHMSPKKTVPFIPTSILTSILTSIITSIITFIIKVSFHLIFHLLVHPLVITLIIEPILKLIFELSFLFLSKWHSIKIHLPIFLITILLDL